MANFDGLSKGEKFTFSKEFMIRTRAIRNLKPSFTDEEVLRAVANKYYANDVASLAKCVGFIKSECGECASLNDLVEAPLDEKAKAYLNSLEEDSKSKEKARDAKVKAIKDKEKDFVKAANNRNKVEADLINAQQKEKNKNIAKLVALGVGILIAFSLIGSLGGFVGIVNALVGFATNLTFTQTFSAIFTIVAGHHIYEKFFKGKAKDKKKAKEEKKKADFSKLEENVKKAKESVETIQGEYAGLKSEIGQAEDAYNQTKGKEMSERAHMANYRATTDIGRKIDDAVNSIKVSFAEAKERLRNNNATEADKKDLEDWYTHYVGAIYTGASRGSITSEQELEEIKLEVGNIFSQIADPLNVSNTNYNNANVHRGTNVRTNQTLDEMYAAI